MRHEIYASENSVDFTDVSILHVGSKNTAAAACDRAAEEMIDFGIANDHDYIATQTQLSLLSFNTVEYIAGFVVKKC